MNILFCDNTFLFLRPFFWFDLDLFDSIGLDKWNWNCDGGDVVFIFELILLESNWNNGDDDDDDSTGLFDVPNWKEDGDDGNAVKLDKSNSNGFNDDNDDDDDDNDDDAIGLVELNWNCNDDDDDDDDIMKMIICVTPHLTTILLLMKCIFISL